MPMNFVSLDKFHRRMLQSGEAISLYVHKLRKLLTHALPNLEQAVRDPFLLHQFLVGIPEAISKQLRASGKVTMLNAAITQARLLMTIDSDPVAVLKAKPDEVELLREQVAVLTEQVAALSTSSKGKYTQPPRSRPHCFHCNQVGHVQ